MDALRHFQHAQTFRLLAQDLGGRLTVERLADHLSALADIVLEGTLRACWAHMVGVAAPPPRFAIIGYGKLGGKELGYASDLDLVFLFDVGRRRPGRRRAGGALRRAWRSGSTRGSPARPPRDSSTTPTCGCAPTARRGCSCRACARSASTSASTRGRGSTRRSRARASSPATREVGAAFEAERDAILRLPRDAAALAADVVDDAPQDAAPAIRTRRRCSTSSTTRAAWSTSSSPCSTSCSPTRTGTRR